MNDFTVQFVSAFCAAWVADEYKKKIKDPDHKIEGLPPKEDIEFLAAEVCKRLTE